ncbi:MAG: OsmC family peroxiredoxin [Proteobacteria bacterium]|nr:OsmC family peroxiredoxin [Pseudomonadota bacterium]
MVKMHTVYAGGLHCELIHEPSSSKIETDAPKDNLGKGERFSPTDLVGAALSSCILTTMAIVAEREGISLVGATAEVVKEMVATPSRRIGSLNVKVQMPSGVPKEAWEKLKQAAYNCPVKKSIHPDIQAEISFL